MKINHANFYFQKCVYQTGRPSHESVPRSSSEFKAGVTKLLRQTQSCFLVQSHAKVYQFDTHTSENKNLPDLSSYDH